MLFGKYPQTYFPRARVRFIRYEGTEEKFGTQMNVIKDVIFDGKILGMVKDSIAYLDTQIKEKTYLGQDGTFVTEEEYPKFVRQEIIVNAITHRDYSIWGTDIQIKMFDDRIVVESPGKLPGLVKPDNIRSTHFSRNPMIAEFLKAYKYVKEYGEGVNRMCNEMKNAGLPDPAFYRNNFMLETVVKNRSSYSENHVSIPSEKVAIEGKKVTIKNKKVAIELLGAKCVGAGLSNIMRDSILEIYKFMESNQVFGRQDIAKSLNFSYANAGKIIVAMKKAEIIVEVTGKGKGKYVFKIIDK